MDADFGALPRNSRAASPRRQKIADIFFQAGVKDTETTRSDSIMSFLLTDPEPVGSLLLRVKQEVSKRQMKHPYRCFGCLGKAAHSCSENEERYCFLDKRFCLLGTRPCVWDLPVFFHQGVIFFADLAQLLREEDANVSFDNVLRYLVENKILIASSNSTKTESDMQFRSTRYEYPHTDVRGEFCTSQNVDESPDAFVSIALVQGINHNCDDFSIRFL
ncbi:hypothetical protein HG531_012093 [Fusarium graminearum]|nr:hypothetical protein HG531_012093 [Fusarium graminearum]